MLKIGGDGRGAALDLRPDPAGGKIAAAGGIAAIHAAYRDTIYATIYADLWGWPAPRSGALQRVSCGLGTPPDGRYRVFVEPAER